MTSSEKKKDKVEKDEKKQLFCHNFLAEKVIAVTNMLCVLTLKYRIMQNDVFAFGWPSHARQTDLSTPNTLGYAVSLR